MVLPHVRVMLDDIRVPFLGRLVSLHSIIEVGDIQFVFRKKYQALSDFLSGLIGIDIPWKPFDQPFKFLLGLKGVDLLPVDGFELTEMTHPFLVDNVGDFSILGM